MKNSTRMGRRRVPDGRGDRVEERVEERGTFSNSAAVDGRCFLVSVAGAVSATPSTATVCGSA